MKLSEVIKAIENRTKIQYKNDGYNAECDFYLDCAKITLCGVATTSFPLYGWEEVKPPRQWSEKELMLFKLLPEWANWISKYGSETMLVTELNENNPSSGKYQFLNKQTFDFLTITQEESPVYIGDLKGE